MEQLEERERERERERRRDGIVQGSMARGGRRVIDGGPLPRRAGRRMPPG
jgi:hypothetical protein